MYPCKCGGVITWNQRFRVWMCDRCGGVDVQHVEDEQPDPRFDGCPSHCVVCGDELVWGSTAECSNCGSIYSRVDQRWSKLEVGGIAPSPTPSPLRHFLDVLIEKLLFPPNEIQS